jgi:glutathione S-transferase
MLDRVTILGSYLSPYVRKVLVLLELKGVAYEIDPMVAFFGDERFSKLSPLRRIPVMIDGDLILTDSSVICQYVEERWPQPALYPLDIADRARARWLEEYADTRMSDVLIWKVFNELAIKPAVWREKGDKDAVARVVAEDVPGVFDYLESQAPADGFFFGAMSIADVSVAAVLRNFQLVRFSVDATRWPKLAALLERIQATPVFQKLGAIESLIFRTPVPQQREAMQQQGLPLTEFSYASATARRGIMPI